MTPQSTQKLLLFLPTNSDKKRNFQVMSATRSPTFISGMQQLATVARLNNVSHLACARAPSSYRVVSRKGTVPWYRTLYTVSHGSALTGGYWCVSMEM
eukprot:scaffold26595_cov63-Attheya_sp.AAC.6